MPRPGVCPAAIVPCALFDEHAGPEHRYWFPLVTSVAVKVASEYEAATVVTGSGVISVTDRHLPAGGFTWR